MDLPQNAHDNDLERLEKTENGEHPSVGLISWEKINLQGRGVDGDVANFLSDLEIYQTVIDFYNSQDIRIANHPTYDMEFHSWAIAHLVESLISSYHKNSEWLRHLPKRSEFSSRLAKGQHYPVHIHRRMAYSTSLLLLERSAYLVAGRRLIESALEKKFLCLNPSCRLSSGTHTALKANCPLVRKMLWRGAWYLRRAQRNLEDFSRSENRNAIKSSYEWDQDLQQAPLLPRLFARSDHKLGPVHGPRLSAYD